MQDQEKHIYRIGRTGTRAPLLIFEPSWILCINRRYVVKLSEIITVHKFYITYTFILAILDEIEDND